MSSCYKFIKGLTHSLLTQSPLRRSILDGNALTDTPRGGFTNSPGGSQSNQVEN